MTEFKSAASIAATEETSIAVTPVLVPTDVPRPLKGEACGNWESLVDALPSPSGGSYNVQITFFRRNTPPLEIRTDRLEMVANGSSVTFNLPGIRGASGGDGHIVAKITEAPGEQPQFVTVSENIDPVWLIGVRNIALVDTNLPVLNRG